MQYKKISFPKDSLPHDHIIEWWYFNGHLHDKNGNHYAFMDCLFRADSKKVKIPFIKRVPWKYIYFSHSLLTDSRTKEFHSDINPLLAVSEDSFSKPLFYVNYTMPTFKGYFNYEMEQTSGSSFRVKSRFFDLVMRSRKRPLLEGGKGFLDLNGKQTYYYSLTNLQTEGWVAVKGKKIRVKGKSWMDHQWADVAYSRDKWSWFSIQLDNNIEMVCFEYDDLKKKTCLMSMIDGHGRQKHTDDIRMTPLGKPWESPKTGARYPLSWKIEVPSWGIELKTRHMIREQEMFSNMINYWEGPVLIEGKMGGKRVKGNGFMELASYPMKKSITGVYRGEFRRILKKQMKITKDKFFNLDRWKIS